MTGILGKQPIRSSGVVGAFASTGIDDNADAIAVTIDSDESVTLSGDLVPSAPLSNRNIIINGAMTVAQRGNGASTLTGSAGYYHTADRMFNFDNCVPANFTRETTNGVLGTETGNTFNDVFPYSWKFASNGTVTSIPAGDRVIFIYKIEGQDVQHLAKGTASAKPVTLSFWVKSTQTGNHQVNLVDNTNTRQIGAVYSISSASTWEKKVITFAGDTTGALANSNANALSIEWWLTAGANYTSGAVPTSWEANAAGDRAVEQQNYVGGSGRTWQITGIQLELGSNATPFEFRSYGDELARCQRYYQKFTGSSDATTMWNLTTSETARRIYFHQEMRDTPSGEVVGTVQNSSGASHTSTTWSIYHSASWRGCSALAINTLSTTSARVDGTTHDSVTAGGASGLYGGADTALIFIAEL